MHTLLNTTAAQSRPSLRRPAASQIAHTREKGLNVTIVRRKSLREFHVTVETLAGEPVDAMVRRLHSFLSAHNAVLIRQEIFGLRSAAPECLEQTAALARAICWPILWLEGKPVNDTALCGIHAFAIAGTEVRWLFDGGQSVASVFSDDYARHCILGGIGPFAQNAPPDEQAAQVFDMIAHELSRARMTWRNVARTWFYLDNILDWYGEFNFIRKEAFDHFDVFSRCMPASTGIGAANVQGSAVAAGAWAVQPLCEEMTVATVKSPLQCSARDYGSCFSRAVEMDAPDLRRLFISGTASISCDGATEFCGDIHRQIERTFEVVDAILQSRAMSWNDVSRATAYLRGAADAPALAAFIEAHRLNLPLVTTEAVVCRDDLLFEIEVDALAATASPNKPDWEI